MEQIMPYYEVAISLNENEEYVESFCDNDLIIARKNAFEWIDQKMSEDKTKNISFRLLFNKADGTLELMVEASEDIIYKGFKEIILKNLLEEFKYFKDNRPKKPGIIKFLTSDSNGTYFNNNRFKLL